MPNDGPAFPRARLAYSAPDEAWAHWLRSALHETGVELTTRERYSREDSLWVIISETALRSPFVAAELGQARRDGVGVMFVLVDGSSPPRRAGDRQVDITNGSDEQRRRRIRSAVRRQIQGPRDAAPVARGEAWSIDRTETDADRVWAADAQIDRGLSRFAPPRAPDGILAARPEFDDLRRLLLDRDSEAGRAVWIVGAAGTGKTSLAATLASELAHSFDAVVWARAGEVPRASRELARSLHDKEGAGKRRGLLVIDDADVVDASVALRQVPPDVDVLATARSRPEIDDEPRRSFVVELPATLDARVARAYLRAFVDGESEVEQALTITGGYVPLVGAVGRFPALWRRGEIQGVVELSTGALAATEGEYFLQTDSPAVIARWERAFSQLTDGDSAIELAEFHLGSWWRRWKRNPTVQSTVDRAERAAEVVALVGPEAQANLNNAEAMARLLEASSEVDELVALAGSIVLVKATSADGRSRVVTETLTPTQLKAFKSQGARLEQPTAALAFIAQLEDGDDPAHLPSGVPAPPGLPAPPDVG